MLTLGEGLLEETFAQLRRCGAGRDECVVYWTSSGNRADHADELMHPVHRSGPRGYEVDAGWLNRAWLELAESDRMIAAQVHTHPRQAFHSATDDGYAIIQTPGFLSLVIPYFAARSVGLEGAYLAELQPDGSWTERDPFTELEVPNAIRG